jgi:hypothetical protein
MAPLAHSGNDIVKAREQAGGEEDEVEDAVEHGVADLGAESLVHGVADIHGGTEHATGEGRHACADAIDDHNLGHGVGVTGRLGGFDAGHGAEEADHTEEKRGRGEVLHELGLAEAGETLTEAAVNVTLEGVGLPGSLGGGLIGALASSGGSGSADGPESVVEVGNRNAIIATVGAAEYFGAALARAGPAEDDGHQDGHERDGERNLAVDGVADVSKETKDDHHEGQEAHHGSLGDGEHRGEREPDEADTRERNVDRGGWDRVTNDVAEEAAENFHEADDEVRRDGHLPAVLGRLLAHRDGVSVRSGLSGVVLGDAGVESGQRDGVDGDVDDGGVQAVGLSGDVEAVLLGRQARGEPGEPDVAEEEAEAAGGDVPLVVDPRPLARDGVFEQVGRGSEAPTAREIAHVHRGAGHAEKGGEVIEEELAESLHLAGTWDGLERGNIVSPCV